MKYEFKFMHKINTKSNIKAVILSMKSNSNLYLHFEIAIASEWTRCIPSQDSAKRIEYGDFQQQIS